MEAIAVLLEPIKQRLAKAPEHDGTEWMKGARREHARLKPDLTRLVAALEVADAAMERARQELLSNRLISILGKGTMYVPAKTVLKCIAEARTKIASILEGK